MSSTRQIVAVTYATAAHAVDLAMQIGAERGVRPVVSVADPSMTVIAFGMADGATPHSVETSRRKAATAASATSPATCTR